MLCNNKQEEAGQDIHDGSALSYRIMKTNLKPSLVYNLSEGFVVDESMMLFSKPPITR